MGPRFIHIVAFAWAALLSQDHVTHTVDVCISSLVPPHLLHSLLCLATVNDTATNVAYTHLSETLAFASRKMSSEGEVLCHGIIILQFLEEQQAVSPVLTPHDIPARVTVPISLQPHQHSLSPGFLA